MEFSLVIRQMLESGVLCGVDQLYRTEVGMAAAQIPNECVTVSRQSRQYVTAHLSGSVKQAAYGGSGL